MTRDTVPVASNLLETNFLGVSVRRFGQSFALPLAPAMVGYILPLVPMVVTTPLFGIGLLVGLTLYTRTPAGQQPLPWGLARLRHRTQPTVYTWQPPDGDEHALETGPTKDEWLTRAVAPTHGGTGGATATMGITHPGDELGTRDTADDKTAYADTADGSRPEVH